MAKLNCSFINGLNKKLIINNKLSLDNPAGMGGDAVVCVKMIKNGVIYLFRNAKKP